MTISDDLRDPLGLFPTAVASNLTSVLRGGSPSFHRAKGLEADIISILGPELLFYPGANTLQAEASATCAHPQYASPRCTAAPGGGEDRRAPRGRPDVREAAPIGEARETELLDMHIAGCVA